MLALQPSALALVLLTLSSCAYAPGGKGFPWEFNFSGFVCDEDTSKHMEGVDWRQAKVIDLRIRQGHFFPTHLGLYVGQSYLLNIENADDIDHSFMAFDFFRAIAVAGVSADGAAFKEINCLAGVTIPPQTKTSLRFVAVRDGTYEFDDKSIINSLTMAGGGGGFITIEPPRNIIRGPVEQSVLSDLIKKNKFDSKNDQVPNSGSSSRKQSKDSINTYTKQSSEPFDGGDVIKSRDSGPSQTKTKSIPSGVSASEEVFDKPSDKSVPDEKAGASNDLGELDKKSTKDKGPEVEDSPTESSVAKEVLDEPSDKSVPDEKAGTSNDLEGELRKNNIQHKGPVVEELPTASENDKGDTDSDLPGGYQSFEGPPADFYSDPPDSSGEQSESDGARGDFGDEKLKSSG